MIPRISIIIPIYGVEAYIERCLKSVKKQTFRDFEVILVNDGTKDNSLVIAEKTVKGDSRFIILNKENGGQGSARNYGLDCAKGEYIAFIDSDDYIEPDYLKKMYEKILEDKAEICTCDIRYVDMNQQVLKFFANNPKEYENKKDYLMVNWHISNFMWDKLFHRSVFDSHRFDVTLRTNEDVHLLFEILYGKRITSVSNYLYNYVQRSHATSKSSPPSLIDDRLKIIKKKLKFADQKLSDLSNFDVIEYKHYAYLHHFVFLTALNLAQYSTKYTKAIKELKGKIDYQIFSFPNILRLFGKRKKLAISLFMFKISPTLFLILIRIWYSADSNPKCNTFVVS